jgi:CRP/FNR family cyclic AMP-dependent transcriptional regulator
MMLCHSYELLSEGLPITVCVSRREVFEKTGVSERTITRVLKDFETKKYISRQGWDILISFDQYLKLKEILENIVYHVE